jgi:hypothetical protein
VAELVERCIELALRLGKHDEDLIDSYYGPQELSQRVEGEEPQLRCTSPPYQHPCWQGRELVEAHVDGDPMRFRALLTARLLPRHL